MSAVLAKGLDSGQRLDRKRVYIFPRRPGLLLGIMIVVILLGAINYDNALGYLLSFLLAGLFLVAMLHTYHNLEGLIFNGAHAAPVFAGEDAEFECHFHNERSLPRLQLTVGQWPRGTTREERRYLTTREQVCHLHDRSPMTVPVAVQTSRRGWQPLWRIRVYSTYPLGILRAWAYFESDADCLVYPAPRGTLPLPEGRSATSGESSANKPGVDDFAGMRKYAPGDPVRAIAWKALARSEDVMVKRFHGEASRRVWLSWAATERAGDLEARLSQLAQWVLAAEESGAVYALSLPGLEIDFARGHQHLHGCLAALAMYHPKP